MHAAALVLAVSAELPSALINGRFFYEPNVNGRRLAIWLDTDGSGFISERTAGELGLPRIGKQARLPSEVVQPAENEGLLPLFSPDPADAIFDGIDAQFGATWFAGRILRMDYLRARLTLLDAAPADAGRLGRARMSGRFPAVDVTVESVAYPMNLDTAATVALDPSALATIRDGWGAVRATSFLRTEVMNEWHAAHPQWPYIGRAGDRVAMLRVPRVTIGSFTAHEVWFSTRPDDDVFEGERVAGKIGPTAFSQAVVTLDYPAGVVYFDG